LAKELNVAFVNAGNHHLLIEFKKIDSYDLSSLCNKLRKRNFFKNSNISLWERSGNSILSRTNEAGAGETLSCGSAAAAIASIVLKKGKGVTVISKGGKISLKSLGNKMEMTGPAEFICEGVWEKN